MRTQNIVTLALLILFSAQPAAATEAKAIYEASCIACHGPTGKGNIPGVPDLHGGAQLQKPDAVLVEHVLNGFQTAGSPMAMPAKGGNPQLTVEDAAALVEYLRRLTIRN